MRQEMVQTTETSGKTRRCVHSKRSQQNRKSKAVAQMECDRSGEAPEAVVPGYIGDTPPLDTAGDQGHPAFMNEIPRVASETESAEEFRRRHLEFYQWVGLCLTRWGYVDEALFGLCRDALGTTAQRAAIVYYRTPGFAGRLALTDELVHAVLADPQRKATGDGSLNAEEWQRLVQRISSLSRIRNILAHQNVTSTGEGTIIQVANNEVKVVQRGVSYFAVMTSQSEQLRPRGRKPVKIKHEELPAHYHDVEAALRDLWAFRKGLAGEET